MSKTSGFDSATWTRALVFGLAAVSLGACSKKDDDDDPKDAAAISDFDGTWATACKADSDGAYNTNTYVISSTTVVATNKNFSDSACKVSAGIDFIVTASFTIGADVTTPAGAQEFDVTPSKATATPVDDETVTGLNSSSFCGATDWAKGTAKDITTCKDEDGKPLAAKFYDVIKFGDDGKSFTNGKNDETHDGSTADKRPVALETDKVYTKQ